MNVVYKSGKAYSRIEIDGVISDIQIYSTNVNNAFVDKTGSVYEKTTINGIEVKIPLISIYEAGPIVKENINIYVEAGAQGPSVNRMYINLTAYKTDLNDLVSVTSEITVSCEFRYINNQAENRSVIIDGVIAVGSSNGGGEIPLPNDYAGLLRITVNYQNPLESDDQIYNYVHNIQIAELFMFSPLTSSNPVLLEILDTGWNGIDQNIEILSLINNAFYTFEFESPAWMGITEIDYKTYRITTGANMDGSIREANIIFTQTETGKTITLHYFNNPA